MYPQGMTGTEVSPSSLLSLAAAGAVLVFVAGAAFAAEVTAVVSPRDGTAQIDNPGCGFAGGSWSTLPVPNGPTEIANLCLSSPNCTKLWSLQKYSKGYVYTVNGEAQTNHYAHVTNFVGGADIPLTENALLSISNSLLACRQNGGTCIPRFAYTWDGWGGAEPDDFSVLLTHIRQLGQVVSQFRDVVPAVECGIIGAYGEMHTSRYTAAEYQNRVVGAWLESIPDDMALLVRSPQVWMKYLNTTTSAFLGGGMDSMDQILRSRMGFYNDGYLGTDYDYGTWGGGGGTTSWSRDEGRAFLKGQAVPYGGEFAGISSDYFDENVHLLDPARFNIVQEWYDTHLSYLRTIRATNMTICQKLAGTTFDSATWAFDGMPDLREYDGIDLRKFCEDHMGCRFVVRSVGYSGAVNAAALSLTVENTGFGQLLFDDALEVVISAADGGGARFCVPVRDVSLRGICGGETGVVELPFAYPVGMEPGEWNFALRVRVPLADEDGRGVPRRAVRFANEGDGAYDFAVKANYLCTVSLERDVDIAEGDIWFAHSAASGRSVGGRWCEPRVSGDVTVREFAIDRSKPRRTAGVVEFDITAELLSSIPEPDGGAASFVFLSDSWRPVPYGYTGDGWLRLGGVEVSEGQSVRLKVVLSPGKVEYWLDGVALTDDAGRSVFPAAAPVGASPSLSLAGAKPVDIGFVATLESLGPEPLTLRLR